MAGLVKAKKYDFKDSNLALFGSDLERQVKKDSAKTEKAWAGAGSKVGKQIWRIVKFKVTHWPKDQYGEFYNGDSYLLLNTYKEPGSEELKYDLHFWIGEYSTQDEYGTAAYKTVELDTLLDDKPVQHREVMNYESNLFKSYFPTGISLLEGGADTGFRHVKPVEYKPRLLHFHCDNKRNVVIRERPLSKHCLDTGDVFILDLGLELYQWNGKTCNKDEKFRAGQYISELKGKRNGKPSVEAIDQAEVSESQNKFMKMLSDDPPEETDGSECKTDSNFQPSIFRLSNESGKMKFTLVSEGKLSKSLLEPKDDTGKKCFVWIGRDASDEEKQNAMAYATNYLKGTNHFLIPITCLKEFDKNAEFNTVMG